MSNMTLIVVGFFFCSIPYRKDNAEFAEIISETLPNASIPYGKGKVKKKFIDGQCVVGYQFPMGKVKRRNRRKR